MNPAPVSMVTMLESRSKDLLCAVEFYAPTYTPHVSRSFEPNNAVAKFATEIVPTYVFHSSITVAYSRDVFEMPSLTRNMGKESNQATVKLSNVPKEFAPTIRPLALFVLNNDVEGMRMVVRWISRANLADPFAPASWISFVGRCGKPSGFNRQQGSITARQDLGQVEAVIPPQIFTKDCPLDFGGPECLGTQILTQKNAAYQAAFAAFGRLGCNKTHGQCDIFDNLEFNQGIRVAQIQGSFIHRPNENFWQKLFGLLTPGSGKRRIRVGSSLEDGTPYGKAVPLVLGRWAVNGIPLQYRDVGTSIQFLMAYARGPISDFINIRCADPAFSTPQAVIEHYGAHGGQANQLADTVFPLDGFYSRLAYITGYVTGTDIAVEDPAPTIIAIVAGIVAPTVTVFSDSVAGEGTTDSPGVYQFINTPWTDNPVDQAVHILTDAGLLNIGVTYLDSARTAKTSVYTTGAVQDETNGERLILPNTEIGKAGVDYKRYNSTGLLCGEGLSTPVGPPLAGPAHEAKYEFYDPAAPPASVALKTFYRKRYTSNIALTEQKKALDFLYDTILPTFKGFLSWDSFGRVGIRCERPADSSLIRTASIATATSIAIDDVLPWTLQFHENNIPLIGKALIGVGLTTSEVREVLSTNYTTAGNSITLTVGSTGGPTLTPSGANFTGGSSSVAATATILVGGTFAEDATVTATIDGVAVTYTLTSSDNSRFKVAKDLAFAINANRTLQKYVVAHVPVLDDVIHLSSKQGVLNLSSALVNPHSLGEETIRVMMAFAGQASDFVAADLPYANILNGSFDYLGNDGQTRYNRFVGKWHDPLRDFAEQTAVINDYEHQESTDLIKTLEIDLAAVDNYNQAARLLNGAAAKHGDGVDFFQWGSNGMALQLEEGDRVCVSDASGGFINVPATIESLTINSKYEITFKARIYSTSMFDDFVEQTDVPLPSGLTNFAAAPPNITFNTVDFPPDGLIQATDGSAGITSIRGGAIFGASVFPQFANVRLIKRAGVTVNILVAVIRPNSVTIPDWEAIIPDFIASAAGEYVVELEVCNQWGCNTTKPTATIFIGLGAVQGLWTTPMVEFSGSGTTDLQGGGNFDIP